MDKSQTFLILSPTIDPLFS